MGKSIINVEGGEVLKTPNGKSYSINGPSHAEGGINMAVPNNSIIFSNRISVGNKTLAERKKIRDKYLDKLETSGKYDALSRNTLKRAGNNAALEEVGDIMAQTMIRNQVEGNTDNIPQAALGAGDIIGMASNIIGPLTNIARTKKAISTSTNPMPNFYKNYGIAGLQQMQAINDDVDMSKANTTNRVMSTLKQKEQDSTAQIDSMGGSLNLRRALRAGSKRSTDQAYADAVSNIEGQTAGIKSEVKSKLANLLNIRDEKVGLGAATAFNHNAAIARDNIASQNAAEGELMTGFQSIGAALNNNDKNKLLQQQLGILAGAYGMQRNPDGTLSPVDIYNTNSNDDNSYLYNTPDLSYDLGEGIETPKFALGGTVGVKKGPKVVFDNSNEEQTSLPKINIPNPFEFLKSMFNVQTPTTNTKPKIEQPVITQPSQNRKATFGKNLTVNITDNNGNIVETRVGGHKNWRNNNPGNIRYGSFAKALGSIGKDKDGFAIFSNMEQGYNAADRLLRGKSYSNLSIEKAISKWAPPNENDTNRYIRKFANAGFDVSKKYTDLSASERRRYLTLKYKTEGGKEGKILKSQIG